MIFQAVIRVQRENDEQVELCGRVLSKLIFIIKFFFSTLSAEMIALLE